MIDPILQLVADNKTLFDALKSHILSKFEQDTPKLDMDDVQLGQITRARLGGLRKVEEAFSDIARLQSTKDLPPTKNPGR